MTFQSHHVNLFELLNIREFLFSAFHQKVDIQVNIILCCLVLLLCSILYQKAAHYKTNTIGIKKPK